MSPQIKSRLGALAQQHQISESALLNRLIEAALLQTTGLAEIDAVTPVEPVPRGARLYVRLRPEDHLLLRERATGRAMAAATYASMVLRAHLRAVAPLPDRERDEIKRAIGALGMVGRNLNQIAKLAHQTGKLAGPSTADLRAVLKALGALRDHIKGLLQANDRSWEAGRG